MYNIIGASAWRYRMASDIWEVKSLLDEALGLRCNACLCCHTSVDELQAMGKAQVNIVLGNEGLAAAEYLEEKFGTPYVYAVPYGYSGTVSFLEQVGAAVGKAPESMVLMRIKMKEKGMSMLSMFAMMGGSKPRQATVKGDYDLVRGVGAFLAQAGITVTHKMCAHSLKAIAEPAADVEAYAEESDWLQVIRGLHDTLILADDVALLQADADNMKVLISAPFMNSAVATHMPFMGEKGADFRHTAEDNKIAHALKACTENTENPCLADFGGTWVLVISYKPISALFCFHLKDNRIQHRQYHQRQQRCSGQTAGNSHSHRIPELAGEHRNQSQYRSEGCQHNRTETHNC